MPSQIILKQAFVHNIKTIPSLKVCKSILVFFASAQLLFGFNFGFVKQMNNEYKMAAQYLSVISALIMSGFTAYCLTINIVWSVYVFHYILTLIILTVNSYTFYEFLSDLINIKISNRTVPKNIGTYMWFYTFFIYFFKLGIAIIYHVIINDESPMIIRQLIMVPILAMDGIPIAIFLVFYHVYDKLKNLKLGFQNSEINVSQVQTIYKDVIDLVDKVALTTDNLMVLGFVADCFKFVYTAWLLLLQLKTMAPWTEQLCCFLYALHLAIQICVPTSCAELVHAETDALHVLVYEQLLQENDKATRDTLVQLAGYIRARPPLRPAWRLLPLGLRLPTALLSICATYLIVVIQFTHLYD